MEKNDELDDCGMAKILLSLVEIELRLGLGCIGGDYGRMKMLSRNQSD